MQGPERGENRPESAVRLPRCEPRSARGLSFERIPKPGVFEIFNSSFGEMQGGVTSSLAVGRAPLSLSHGNWRPPFWITCNISQLFLKGSPGTSRPGYDSNSQHGVT